MDLASAALLRLSHEVRRRRALEAALRASVKRAWGGEDMPEETAAVHEESHYCQLPLKPEALTPEGTAGSTSRCDVIAVTRSSVNALLVMCFLSTVMLYVL